MEIFNYILANYANFSGRMSRANYWIYVLVFWLVNVVFSVLENVSGVFSWVALVWTLFIFVPQLAFGVRRLHDTNRSGWWLLLSFIPIIGWIVLLVFSLLAGDPGTNNYGEPETVSPFQ